MKRYHESNHGFCFTKGDMHHLQMEQSVESLLSEVSAFVIKTLFLFLEESAILKGLCYAPMHKIHVFIKEEKLKNLAQRRVHNLSPAQSSPHLNSAHLHRFYLLIVSISKK